MYDNERAKMEPEDLAIRASLQDSESQATDRMGEGITRVHTLLARNIQDIADLRIMLTRLEKAVPGGMSR
jgi:argininosuccinate lyase